MDGNEIRNLIDAANALSATSGFLQEMADNLQKTQDIVNNRLSVLEDKINKQKALNKTIANLL